MDNLTLMDKIMKELQAKYNLVRSFYISKYSTPQEKGRIHDMYTTALTVANITANEFGMKFRSGENWKVICEPIKKENNNG